MALLRDVGAPGQSAARMFHALALMMGAMDHGITF